MRFVMRGPASLLSRAGWVAVFSMVRSACSSTRPWVNGPITEQSPTPAALVRLADDGKPHAIIGAVTLSGGGARAAAFGLGVLKELDATQFALDGQNTTLMAQMGLVSGVSGGSVLAAYYAAFGEETFTRFEPDFLMQDFQAGLIAQAFSPRSLYRISSPWYGRSNVLAEKLDMLYRGKTFGDLLAQQRGPRLLITATDLTTGAPFEFTPEQFALICSDLNSVPLSYAVAASSSVPLLLSPVTVRNYAGKCPPVQAGGSGCARGRQSAGAPAGRECAKLSGRRRTAVPASGRRWPD